MLTMRECTSKSGKSFLISVRQKIQLTSKVDHLTLFMSFSESRQNLVLVVGGMIRSGLKITRSFKKFGIMINSTESEAIIFTSLISN